MTIIEIIAILGLILGGSWLGVYIKARSDKKNLAATTDKTKNESDKIKIDNEITFTKYLKDQLATVLTELAEIRKENIECKRDNGLLRKEVAELKLMVTRQTLTIEELKDKR